MYRTILVPLDGSTFAEHALPTALAIARRAGATLRLVTVSTPFVEAYVEGLYFSTAELEQEMTVRYSTYLDLVASRLRQRVPVPILTEVKHGEVAPTLCGIVDAGEADLVVMATHGRGALGRFWLGSVADEMIRHVHSPLLLVRPEESSVDFTQEPDLGRVVIALDGTPEAEQIIEPAVALAGLMPGAEVTLMRAIHSVIPVTAAPDVPDAQKEARSLLMQVQSLQGRLRQDADRYLEVVAERLRGRGVKVQTHVLVEDQPAAAILQEVARQRANLIALETHARRGLSRMVLGSIADKVIRAAHCAVLVHHGIAPEMGKQVPAATAAS